MAKSTRKIERNQRASRLAPKSLPGEAQARLKELHAQLLALKSALADLDVQSARIDSARRQALQAVVDKQEEMASAANAAVGSMGFDLQKQRVTIDLSSMSVIPAT